uniref:Retrotransposon Copia-like N-terminal domain-containing protein n=1 Tax=Manihot esculenta TaxID=3983 RepID=A0A2C9WF65_MANES
MNTLHSKNKAGFVDGTIKRPNADSLNLQTWIQCKAMVISWLTNALATEIQVNAAHIKTAREIWVDLEERFMQGIAPRVYDLRRSITMLQQE